MEVNKLLGTCKWNYTPENTWFAELTEHTPDDIDSIREKITEIIENLDREITDEERALFAFSYKTVLRKLRTNLDLVDMYSPQLKDRKDEDDMGVVDGGPEVSEDFKNQEFISGRIP